MSDNRPEELGTIGEVRFSFRPNGNGGVDVPPARNGVRNLAIGYQYQDVCGFVYREIEGDDVAVLARDITGFFKRHKEELYRGAMESIHTTS